jgi:hypothetical protein
VCGVCGVCGRLHLAQGQGLCGPDVTFASAELIHGYSDAYLSGTRCASEERGRPHTCTHTHTHQALSVCCTKGGVSDGGPLVLTGGPSRQHRA